MDLSKYDRVVITTKTFDGVPRIKTRTMYEADLIIMYHKGVFTTFKDRRNPRDKQIKIDEKTAAKFLLQDEKVLYLKWKKRKHPNMKKESKSFEKKLNEILR